MIHTVRAATLLLILLARPGQAQPSVLEFAPLQVVASGLYAADAGVGSAVLTARRTVPLFFFLPQVSEDSRVDLLALSAGVRTTNRDASLAWAVRPLDLFISKSPWAGGLTLLAYNRSGPLRIEATWIGLKAGPVFRSGDDQRFVEARLLGGASMSTVAVTGGLFVGSGRSATGLDASLTAQVRSKLGNTVSVEGEASASRLFSGANPERRHWNLGVRLGSGHVSVLGSVGQLQIESQRFRRASEWLIRVGVRVVPGERGF
jgi:hypothetical protein